ncbi:MAG: hypothetical protein RR048_07195, partial [Oscillospiraceae bacterium]
PTFDYLGTFSYAVPDPDEKYYIYQINGKSLEEVDARYDKDTECLVFKTRTLGSYVISEGSKLSARPSNSTSDTDDSENITVGSTNSSDNSDNSGNTETNVGATKPNFNSSDNNVLDLMIVTAVVSAIGICGTIGRKKAQ